MNDSFFDFDSSSLLTPDQTFEEEDDTDYDALNSETFGEDLSSTDWEEVHEQLASDLEKRRLDDENNDLRGLERIASYILDDEGEDAGAGRSDKPYPRTDVAPNNDSGKWWLRNVPPPPILTVNELEEKLLQSASKRPSTYQVLARPSHPDERVHGRPSHPDERIHGRPSHPDERVHGRPSHPDERVHGRPSHPDERVHGRPFYPDEHVHGRPSHPDERVHGPPFHPDERVHGRPFHPDERVHGRPFHPDERVHGRPSHPDERVYARLSHPDERDMLNIPNRVQNGNYSRGRGTMVSGRRRYHPEAGMDQPYQEVHHPYPPYHSSSGMMRPLPHRLPAHPGHMFRKDGVRQDGARQEAGRYMGTGMVAGSGMGPVRTPRPVGHSYYTNQSSFGRAGPPQPFDRYAGLMTLQEVQWLVAIQMMQLNTANPSQDDFYYTMFQQRQGSCGRKNAGNQNQQNNRDSATPKPMYSPQQFENSLGKLQIGSVTAPRKIIDMDVVENCDYNSKQVDRRTRQVLLEIEELYGILLEIEEIRRNTDITNGRTEYELTRLQEYKCLKILFAEGKLLQIMSIRKGRHLVLRLTCTLSLQNQVQLVWRLLLNLPAITRKDSDNMLLTFLPFIRAFLSRIGLCTLVELANNYVGHFLLSNKFTVSVMANMIERADQIKDEVDDPPTVEEWNMFLIRLVKSTKYCVDTERPVVAVDRNVLLRHLAPIENQVHPENLAALVRTLQPATCVRAATPTTASTPSKNTTSTAQSTPPTTATSSRTSTPNMMNFDTSTVASMSADVSATSTPDETEI